MNLNLANSAAANLCALISVSNGNKALSQDDVLFAQITTFDNGEGGNTSVEATASDSSTAYVGSQTFFYNRLDLATEAGYAGVTPELENVAEDAATGDLLAAALSLLGLMGSEVEVGAVTLPVGDTNGSLELNALSDSLLYTGSVVVTLVAIDNREALDDAFANQNLETLEGPVSEPV